MANRRQKTRPIVARERAPSKERHAENLRYLSRKGWKGDPTNKHAVAASAAEYRSRDTIAKRYGRKISSTEARLLKRHGFDVKGDTLILDKPRVRGAERIKHHKFRDRLPAKETISKEGIVKQSYKNRRDYIVGFDKAQRKRFAENPKGELDNILDTLKKRYKDVRGRRKKQVRLQWGAFESRKDFSPQQFIKFLDTARKVAAMLKKKYGSKVKTPLDKLTGVHIVVHVQKKRK